MECQQQQQIINNLNFGTASKIYNIIVNSKWDKFPPILEGGYCIYVWPQQRWLCRGNGCLKQAVSKCWTPHNGSGILSQEVNLWLRLCVGLSIACWVWRRVWSLWVWPQRRTTSPGTPWETTETSPCSPAGILEIGAYFQTSVFLKSKDTDGASLCSPIGWGPIG